MSEPILESGKKQADVLDRILVIGQAAQQHITRNPRQVYQLIVQAACEMTGADCAVLYPYHPSFGEFYDVDNVAAHGLCHELQLDDKPKKGLAALVHQEGEVIREDVEQQDPQILEQSVFIAREEIKAFMGLSLQVNDNILGILYVDYRKPHHFSEDEKRIIRVLGQQAAIAISSSWALRLANIRAQTVAKLKTVGQTLIAIEGQPKPLESVLDEIARGAQEVLDADIVDLYQYIQARHEFLLPPTLVGKRWHPHVPKTKIYDDDVVVQAVKAAKPQYFLDAQETSSLTGKFEVPRDDAPDQRFVVREGVVSSAIIPLIVAGETVGVMFVNYRSPQVFGPEQKDVIESFAAQAAVAIYNARLLRAEQEQRQQSDTLREVARIVNATLEREEVVGLVLEQLRRVIEYRSASIQLIQGDRRLLIGGRGFSIQDSPRELLHNVSQDPLVSKIVRSQKPLVLSDVKDEPLWDHMPQTAQTNSWIGAPLVARGQVIGLLTLDHEQAGHYTEASGELVAAFANQVAVAIHNTHLFQQVSEQTRALAELNELSSQLVSLEESPRDTRSLLEQVARSAQQVLQADMIELYEYVQEQDDYRLPQIWVGERKGPVVPKDKVYKDDAVFNLIHREKPLYVEDTQANATLSGPYIVERKDQPTERFVIREGIQSSAAIPLKTGTETVGLMFANYRAPQTFAPGQRELIESFANQAAIAIHNSRLLNALERRVEALGVLNEVGQTLTAGLRMRQDEILELIYEQTDRLMDASNMLIALYDETKDQINYGLVMKNGARAQVGRGRWAARQAGKRRTEGVIRSRHPLLHKTEAEARQWYLEAYDDKDAGEISRCWLGVPMMAGEKVLGVIAVRDPKQEHVYDETDLQTLSSIASQAAIALDNASLYQYLERQVEALATLNEVGQTLTAGLRLKEDQILELIYAQARKLTGTLDMYIALYDDATQMIRFPLALERGEWMDYPLRQADMEKRGKTEEIILTREPILHRTQQEAEDWYGAPGRQEFIGRVSRSYLGVPLIVGEKVLGVIALWDWERENVYDEQNLQVLSAMASQAAIALDNASLYYEVNQALERRVEALAALNEVGQTLTAGIRLQEDEVLKLIYEQARKLTGTLDMYIALYDDATEMVRFPLALEKGKRKDYPPRQADMKKRGKTEEIILTREPILHKTRQEAEDWYKAPGHQEFVGHPAPSWVGVPMIISERVLGVIAIYDWEREHIYDEQDLQILSSMASQAAIALDNASLYYEVNQALERRVEALAALNEVGQTLTAGLRLEQDEVLQLIYEQARELTDTGNIYIALYDESTDTINFRLVMEKGARVDVTQHASFAPRKIDRNELGKTEAVILSREPILHKTRAEEREWYSQAGHRQYVGQGSASHIAVPMMLGERVLGVIAIYDWEREHAYDEQDLQILSSMASQAAIALDNADLYYEVNRRLDRRVEQIQTVQEITNTIKTHEELPDLLQSILDVSLPRLKAQAGTIRLVDERTNELVVQAVTGPVEQKQYERLTLDRGITGQAVRQERPIYVPDTSQDERYLVYLGQMRSELAIPLKTGDRVIGVFNIEDPRPDAFDKETRELSTLIADQAAIVIQNARQYAAAREELIASRQLATLGTATAAIQHRINNTLNIIMPNITLLRKRVDLSDETIQGILDIIERNAQYTTDYITRIQEPLKETQIQTISINTSLRDAQAQVGRHYQSEAGLGTVEVIYELEDSLPLIEASLGHITEIFRNLIENSYIAMGPRGGALTIVSRRVSHWLEIEIRDTGAGIPSNIRDRLFIKPVPSRKPGVGSGLGLWLTGLLLQKYAGEIKVKDTGSDGTTMLVRLPISRSWQQA